MNPLQLLLVSVPEAWRNSLDVALQTLGHPHKVIEAQDKQEALRACSQCKFDLLIANHDLPDGSPEDLVNVLSGSMATLVVHWDHAPESWVKMLRQTLDDWKNKVHSKAKENLHNKQMRYATAIQRCAQELKTLSDSEIDRALSVVLDVLEVSRVYIRETPIGEVGPPYITHELAAPGHLPILGSRRSTYEVSVQRTDGRVFHLGVEDVTHQRSWSQPETDLVQSVAYLIKESSGGIHGSANLNLGIRLSA